MNQTFKEYTNRVPELFTSLQTSPLIMEKGTLAQKGKSGVYAFFEGSTPVYVGRTRHLQRRLRGHITFSHYTATFAFKTARRNLNAPVTYKPLGSRTSLMEDATFRAELEKQIARTKEMWVRFVEVKDPILQYLLELYACLEWKLPLDEFDTH
jgi:hypothetical protein